MPPGKDGSKLATKAQFKGLKAGNRVSLVCKMHDPQKEFPSRIPKWLWDSARRTPKPSKFCIVYTKAR